MTARDQITAALAGVTLPDGSKLSAYDSEPDTKHALAAWPVLRGLTREGTLCSPYARAYDVFAVLPNDYAATAADTAEDLIGLLVSAMEPLGEVGEGDFSAEVVQIQFDNQSTVPGIRVRVIPEEG